MEVFAAKDFRGFFLSAPARCGLKQADTLSVSAKRLSVMAMHGNTVLDLDLPDLTPESLAKLQELEKAGGRLAVAEFSPLGLFDAYFLNVKFV